LKLFNIILGIFLTKITIFVSACHHDVSYLDEVVAACLPPTTS
jgi:hypothetical protein